MMNNKDVKEVNLTISCTNTKALTRFLSICISSAIIKKVLGLKEISFIISNTKDWGGKQL